MQKSMEIIVENIDELPVVAGQLIEFAGNRKKWTFTGEIGAGKTTFIQAICTKLGIIDKVTSPTFSLINQYVFADDHPKEDFLYHIDLYRLNSLEEAINIGIEDCLYDDRYCFIEWPQLLEPILPDDVLQINLQIIENSKRKMIFL
jgi:tRNA threonylcarbamoyladenosine biosynthesis protein TsaE